MLLPSMCYSNYCLRHPEAVLAIIPTVIIIIILMRHDFVKFGTRKEQEEYLQSTKFPKLFIALTRIIIFSLLLVAVASPYTTKEEVVEGDPTLKILLDNSTSFSMFDPSVGENLVKDLEGKLPVEVRTIGFGESSPLGDALLSSLEGNDNVLLVSDGNSHGGRDLGDMMLFASLLNSTVSSLDINPMQSDLRIKVVGPREIIVDSETEYLLDIRKVGNPGEYEVQVDVDGQTILKESNIESKTFKLRLAEGFHKITATALLNDYFPQNNIYYKTVKVVPRPKILFITKKPSPLLKNLESIYEIETDSSIPEKIDGYQALVLNNLEAAEIEPRFEALSDYVALGNGLVAVGGDKSFARGSYKDNIIESLMPVKVGEGEKTRESKINVMIVIDISESTGLSFGASAAIDVEKSLAIDIWKDISHEHQIGVVAFNHRAYQVSPLGLKADHPEAVLKIASLQDTGGTLVYAGLKKAIYALQAAQGAKNIVVISDGITQHPENAFSEARDAAKNGMKIYTVGVGDRTNEEFMKALAAAGEGIYYRPTEKQNLKLLFGEVEEELPEEGKLSLVITNPNEFITKSLSVSSVISGYNYVVPKQISRVLVSTNTGDPIITTWRYGLGNVIAYTTDDGSIWSGSMLAKDNFKLLIRMINFAIGDPSRTMKADIDAKDTTVGEPTTVTVIGREPSGLQFSKAESGVYIAQFSSNTTGFHKILDAVVGVNYNPEYGNVGMNEEFPDLVSTVGGSVFDPNDIDRIIETVRKNSRRVTVHTVEYKWPLLIAIIVFLLFEIYVRKIRELRAWRSRR